MRVAGLVMISLLVLLTAAEEEKESVVKKAFDIMRASLKNEKGTSGKTLLIQEAIRMCEHELVPQEKEILNKGAAKADEKEGGKLVTQILLGCMMKKMFVDTKGQKVMARTSAGVNKEFTEISKCAKKQNNMEKGPALDGYESLGRHIFENNACGGFEEHIF